MGEIASLSNLRDDLMIELQSARSELQQNISTITLLKEALDTSDESHSNSLQEVMDKDKKISTLPEAIEAKDAAFKDLKKSLESKSLLLEEVEKQVKSLHNENFELKNTCRGTPQLEQSLGEVKSELQKCQSALKEELIEKEHSIDKVNALSQENSALEARVSLIPDLERQISAFKSDLASARASLASESDDLKETQKTVDRLRKDKVDLEARLGAIATLQSEVKTMSSELDSAKAMLATENSNVTSLEQKLATLQEEKRALQSEASMARVLKTQAQKLSEELDLSKESTLRQRKSLESANKKLKALVDDNDALRVEASAAPALKEDLKSKNFELEEVNHALTNKTKALLTERETSKALRNEKAALEKKVLEVPRLQKQLSSKAKELERTKAVYSQKVKIYQM